MDTRKICKKLTLQVTFSYDGVGGAVAVLNFSDGAGWGGGGATFLLPRPSLVYTICQNHPHLGLKLYDIVRNAQTHFSLISSKWKEILITHAL